jgi:multidrug resistance efflux pump
MMIMKRKKIVWLSLTVIVVAIAAWAFRPAPAAQPAPTATFTGELVAPALVEARGDRVELAFETSGRVAAVLVDEGARVQAGDVLARLDDRVARARVARAEAALAAAVARRDLAVRGPRSDERKAARAEAKAAAALAWERGQARGRAEKLRGDSPDAIALAEVDAARGQSDTAAAQAEAAAARAALLTKGTRAELIAEATALVQAATAELEEARALLGHTELRAPAAGVVLRRLVEPGEQVTMMPPTVALVIADTDHIEIRAEIDERDIGKVAAGQAGWVDADAYGDQRFTGTITRVTGELGRKRVRNDDPRARLDTRILEVVFTLDQPTSLPLGLRMDLHLTAN